MTCFDAAALVQINAKFRGNFRRWDNRGSMILNCPSCDTRFLIDPTLIGQSGRTVRCGRCAHNWFQVPQPEPEAAETDGADGADGADAETAPIPRLREFDEARRRSTSRARPPALAGPSGMIARPSQKMIWWAGLAGFVLILLLSATLGRNQIVAALPETEKLYALVGLGPSQPEVAEELPIGEGLELRDVTSVRRLVDGQRMLLIEGSIVNISDEPRPVPHLRAVVTDADGVELTKWTFAAEGADLEPGAETRFKTTTENPPSQGNLSLIFVGGL